MPDMSQYMRNPAALPLKKYMHQLLGDRYGKHEAFFDRFFASLVTGEDVQNWGKLVVDLYEMGYLKAADQYREQLNKLGYNLNIVPGATSNAAPIFSNQKK